MGLCFLDSIVHADAGPYYHIHVHVCIAFSNLLYTIIAVVFSASYLKDASVTPDFISSLCHHQKPLTKIILVSGVCNLYPCTCSYKA